MSGPHPSIGRRRWDVTSMPPQQLRRELRSDKNHWRTRPEALDDIGYPEDASLVIIFSGIHSATGFLMKAFNFADCGGQLIVCDNFRWRCMTAKILVVDDEPDLEALVVQKFRHKIREGAVAFLFAHDGLEALAVLDENRDVDRPAEFSPGLLFFFGGWAFSTWRMEILSDTAPAGNRTEGRGGGTNGGILVRRAIGDLRRNGADRPRNWRACPYYWVIGAYSALVDRLIWSGEGNVRPGTYRWVCGGR